jgi:hypothetical protein
VAQDVLEEDLQGHGRAPEVDAVVEGGEAIDVWQAPAERGSGAEWIVLVRGSALGLLCETRRMEAYSAIGPGPGG